MIGCQQGTGLLHGESRSLQTVLSVLEKWKQGTTCCSFVSTALTCGLRSLTDAIRLLQCLQTDLSSFLGSETHPQRRGLC